jgi:Na+-driven multidrug efflux pump
LPIVGFNLGARNFPRLWRAVKLAAVGIAVMLAVFTILVEAFTPQLVGIFTNEAGLLSITIVAMRITMVTLPLIGPTVIFVTTFQGLSKGVMALVLSLVRQFIFFVPLMYLLRYLLGLNGVWISWPASDFLGFVVVSWVIYREYRKQRKSGEWPGTSPAAGWGGDKLLP